MSNNILKFIKNMPDDKSWFCLNLESEIPEILIYDFIGETWDGQGTTPVKFRDALQACEKKSKRMNLRINSPGGLIHDSFAIYNMIKQSPLEVDAYIDGLAASCASWIPMACKNIYISPQSEMMIHMPWSMVIGTASEMRKEADHLDSLMNTITGIYVEKTGLKKDKIEKMIADTTWMSGTEAVEMGFADEFSEPSMAAACAYDFSSLPQVPKRFQKYQNALKKRAEEKSLRDAGMSRAEAARCAASKSESNIQKQAQENLTKEILKCLNQ